MKFLAGDRLITPGFLWVIALALATGVALSRWGQSSPWAVALAGTCALYLVFLLAVRRAHRREVGSETPGADAGRIEREVATRTRELENKTERVAREPVNVVVTDVVMPRMDGLALTRHLHERPEGVTR